ncbi:hypothetical protein B5X24_HaOG209004, partial [Helicoverpa armigera]
IPLEYQTENHNDMYKSIKQQLEDLKNQNLQQIDAMSETTHYTIIYSTLILVVLVLMAYTIFRLGKKWLTRRHVNRAQQQQQQRAQGSDLKRSRSRDSVVSDAVSESG